MSIAMNRKTGPANSTMAAPGAICFQLSGLSLRLMRRPLGGFS